MLTLSVQLSSIVILTTLLDIYTEANCLSVGFKPTLFTRLIHTMFLSVSNIKSSSVAELAVNANTKQALVKYIGNDQPYLYSNVDFAPLYDLIYTEIESIGKWVNTNLKQNAAVTCFAV